SSLRRLREDHATLARQRTDSWLAAFVERWQLRHPQASLRALATPAAAAAAVEVARISQILTILLDNAARSQFAAGYAMHTEPPLRLDLSLDTDDGKAVLSCRVSDRGTGIAPALRARLGEAPVASSHGRP